MISGKLCVKWWKTGIIHRDSSSKPNCSHTIWYTMCPWITEVGKCWLLVLVVKRLLIIVSGCKNSSYQKTKSVLLDKSKCLRIKIKWDKLSKRWVPNLPNWNWGKVAVGYLSIYQGKAFILSRNSQWHIFWRTVWFTMFSELH